MNFSGLTFGRWQRFYFKQRNVNGYSGTSVTSAVDKLIAKN